MIQKIVAVIALLTVGAASFFLGYTSVDTGYTGSTEINQAVVLNVMEELMNNHYTQPTEDELYQGMIDGMIASLDDPHTSYFDMESYQQFLGNFGESYVGIGVRVYMTDGLLVVEEVISGGPADGAGIRPNDIIAFVDGVDVRDWAMYDILALIVGDEGTEVTIGIIRNGYEDVLPFVMTREVIDNSSVNVMTYLEGTQLIGYIEVTQFGDETDEKFNEAITQLESLNIDSLIVDLRNNGGGHLTTVLSMLREFLVLDSQPMFYTQYYVNGQLRQDDYYGTRSTYKDYNIVTLVNGNSASASEVFASAMQEHGNYILLGTTTYGKGTMQTDHYLSATESDYLHISIGRWFTSNGNWVHFNGGTDGITPDIVVEPSPAELAYKMFLFDGETFTYDQVDSRIQNLQYILNALGYSVRSDGYFDTQTEAAILDIQHILGITEDGVVTNEVLSYVNDQLTAYLADTANDSQLTAAIQYLVEYPSRD